MKLQFSHGERLAGLFMLFAILGMVAFIVGAAIENRWLEPRLTYHTHIVRGEGLRKGSPVLLSGIEVGEVSSLTILEDNRVDVELLIRARHADRVRTGTKAEVRRLLGIGEKRINLVSEGTLGERLPPNALLPANEPMDILDAVSNIDLGQYMNTVDRAVGAMEVMLSKLEEERRLVRIMEAFDQMGPTMEKLNSILTQIDEPVVELFQDKSLRNTFKGADRLFNDPNTRKAMKAVSGAFEPEKITQLVSRMDRAAMRFDDLLQEDSHFNQTMAGANKLLNDGRTDRMLTSMEQLIDAKTLNKLVKNMNTLTEQLAKMGPEIPTISKELIRTMREAVIVLKALQKTWLLDGETEEVLRELRKKK